MKIIVHDYSGHPFQVQLSRGLARRGHQVLHLYSGSNDTPHGSLAKSKEDPITFDSKSIRMHQQIQKGALVHRWLQENEYGRLLAKEIEAYHPDLVISANTPLDAQAKALQSTHKVGGRFIFWLQDITGLATYLTLKKKNRLLGFVVGNYYIWLEKYLFRHSDHIVAIADDFLRPLKGWGISPEHCSVIPNWGPLNEMPVRQKITQWSLAQDVADKKLILYTGSLGMKHDPNLLLQLAIAFQQDEQVRVMVVSEGLGSEWLRKQKNKLGLENLLLLGYQPMKELPDMLGAGDVLVSILEPDAGDFSIPSKVLSYLCAKKPLLLSIPERNLAARIVKENHAGEIVSPGDVESFIAAARKLMNNAMAREQYGANARRYAETHFRIENITEQFEKIMVQTFSTETAFSSFRRERKESASNMA